MAVGLQLDAVQPGRLHALGRRRIGRDDALDIPVLGLLGKSAVGRLADRRGGQYRQPVRLVPVGAPAEMGKLDHRRRAMVAALVGQPPQPRHDLVPVGMQIAEGGGRIFGHNRRARGHVQRNAAPGLFHMIEAVAVGRHAVHGISGLMRARHDAVAQFQMLQPIGPQQGVRGGHAFFPWRGMRSIAYGKVR